MPEYLPTLSELLYCSFVIIDKPRGPSSHEVAAFVRKILGSEKSGHSGTLDPNVSGVLPVGIGRATRLLPYVTTKDKRYVCLMRTGREMTEGEIKSMFAKFTGTITQTPPKQSAVAKRPRKRKVYYINPLQLKSKEVLFEVHCEAGTYVRVLVSGFAAFCNGAEMLELRRISVGSITEGRAVTLQALSDAMWLALEKRDESAIREILLSPSETLCLPKVTLRDSAVEAVCAGSPLYPPGLANAERAGAGDAVCLVTTKGEFVGVGRACVPSEEMPGHRGKIVVPEATVMKRGTYPKNWRSPPARQD